MSVARRGAPGTHCVSGTRCASWDSALPGLVGLAALRGNTAARTESLRHNVGRNFSSAAIASVPPQPLRRDGTCPAFRFPFFAADLEGPPYVGSKIRSEVCLAPALPRGAERRVRQGPQARVRRAKRVPYGAGSGADAAGAGDAASTRWLRPAAVVKPFTKRSSADRSRIVETAKKSACRRSRVRSSTK